MKKICLIVFLAVMAVSDNLPDCRSLGWQTNCLIASASTSWQPKVSTQVFAPEAQRRLAGGAGFAKPPDRRGILFPALEGRLTKASSVALPGLGGLLPLIPVVTLRSPPANIRRPFRTKTDYPACVDTFGWQLVEHLPAVSQDSQTVPDVSLTIKDVAGRSQSPFKLENQTASVLFFILQDCPISNRFAPEIARIVQNYKSKPVRFFLVYVDAAASAKEIEQHGREYNLSGLTVIQDSKHQLVAATGASITPEVAVIGQKGAIVYRGRIDNLYEALGKPRRVVTEHELRNALDAVLQNKKVPVARTSAIGCYITAQN